MAFRKTSAMPIGIELSLEKQFNNLVVAANFPPMQQVRHCRDLFMARSSHRGCTYLLRAA